MTTALTGIYNTKNKEPERDKKETEDLKNQFLLAVNGYHIGEIKEENLTKINEYVVQGDGIYVVIRNSIGKFVQKIINREFPGLPVQFGGKKVFLDVPKIPADIYWQVKSFFTDISNEMGENEAFCQVFLNKETEEYTVHVPKQKISKASVVYEADDKPGDTEEEQDKYLLVYECHSHNTMGAFWSGTDDADEKNTRFYGVFGRLDKEEYEEEHRYVVMGESVPIKRSDIFDFSNENKVNSSELKNFLSEKGQDFIDKSEIFKIINSHRDKKYPKEWYDNIEIASATSYSYAGYGGSYYNRGNTTGALPGQTKKNTATPGRRGNSTQYSSYYDEEYWDYMDEYRDQQLENFGESEATELEEEEADALSNMREKEIEESFDLSDVEDLFMDTALEAFASTIEPEFVGPLAEKLIEYGHHGDLQAVIR